MVLAHSDFVLLFFSSFLAISLSHNNFLILDFEQIFRMLWVPILGVIFLAILGIYKSVVRFIEFSVIYKLVWVLIFIFMIIFVITIYLGDHLGLFLPFIPPREIEISPEAWTIGFLSSLILIIGSRILDHNLKISMHLLTVEIKIIVK